jgi:hypothetical protein
MSEREPAQRGELSSQADRTLLGVAPPRIDNTADSPGRSPVFVRSGTSIADVEPAPLPRMALPGRPPARFPSGAPGVSEAPSPFAESGGGKAWALAMLNLPARVAGTQVALWKVLAPGLVAVLTLAVLVVKLIGAAAMAPQVVVQTGAPLATANGAPAGPSEAAPIAKPTSAKPASAALAQLAGKAPETMSSSELLQLADGRVEQEREAAHALRLKLESTPALAKDKASQSELLRLAGDADTAHEALAAMVQLQAPIGADLLYEVWTGTTARNDTTELARTLVYSTDVRPKASAALAVALELRLAESCEQFQVALPKALKDGDRRALHLLTKLSSKRGCGPKKSEDCFACLRAQSDELTATINAVKSRRPPGYVSP